MTDKKSEKKPAKDSKGLFVVGNRGGGRPKGSPDRRTAPFRTKIDTALPDILDTVIEQAKGGDLAACKILIDKSLPNVRPTDTPRKLPIDGDTLTDKAASIVDGVADGSISTDEAARLLQALGSAARIIETDELERRVSALEVKHGTKH